ncbi:MAG: response regulator [Anaerolineae bacterium]|nr:response regulator [Anaerolineae bacterium]MDW8170951.1 response regulator [Anaerolineae bacterium]
MEPKDWRILVVEDEYDSVQMVTKILQHHGVQVFVAHNGQECIDMLPKIKPTLVVMDLALPEMDGWETLARMRANPETADIPVVAITAYHSVNVEADARRAGFDAYLSKPLDVQSLVRSLNAIISM